MAATMSSSLFSAAMPTTAAVSIQLPQNSGLLDALVLIAGSIGENSPITAMKSRLQRICSYRSNEDSGKD